MKYTLTLIATLLVCLCTYAQSGTTNDTSKYIINQGYGYQYYRWKVENNLTIPHAGADTSSKNPGQVRMIDTSLWYSDRLGHWRTGGSGGGGDFSDFVRIVSQPPTVSISGGTTQELKAITDAAQTINLNWSAGRLAAGTNLKATEPLATILVNNITKTFTQPAIGASVSGTQSVSVPPNITSSFSIVATTTDGKSATAVTSFSFLPKRYYGWVDTLAPTDARIIALSSELSASPAKTWVQAADAGKRLCYAYPASEGDLTIFKINDFTALNAFTKTVRAFTNASGFTQNYNIYVSNNIFTVTTPTTALTQ